MLPGDMRAKAGEVMAQSSARISESADAIRSALESGRVAAPAPADKFKRRQSDGGGGNPDLEDGRGGGKGGRRAAGGEGDDDEVRLLNVNELLSEEEVRSPSRLPCGPSASPWFGDICWLVVVWKRRGGGVWFGLGVPSWARMVFCGGRASQSLWNS